MYIHSYCLYFLLQNFIYGRVRGMVTVAIFGSPNTTPCVNASGGITNLTENRKSMSLTGSRNSQIGTLAAV